MLAVVVALELCTIVWMVMEIIRLARDKVEFAVRTIGGVANQAALTLKKSMSTQVARTLTLGSKRSGATATNEEFE